jgi:hypothetical protein
MKKHLWNDHELDILFDIKKHAAIAKIGINFAI